MVESKKLIDYLFECVNLLLLTLLTICCLYPCLYVLWASLSEPVQLYTGSKILLWPRGFNTGAFMLVFKNPNIWMGYRNTLLYVVAGTALGMLLCILGAFVLSRSRFPGQSFFMTVLIITMFFGGGLIPYYVTIMRLKLIDTFWVMVLPGAISAYNVIVFKTFFMSIPESLKESAFLDGAGHLRVLFSIVLPLSKAVLATFALFSIVGYWNDYLTALLYLRDDKKYPIQLLIRRLLVLMDYKDASTAQILKDFRSISTRTTKAAATIITVVPILCVYPFMQKYFAKGVLVGSIKA